MNEVILVNIQNSGVVFCFYNLSAMKLTNMTKLSTNWCDVINWIVIMWLYKYYLPS